MGLRLLLPTAIVLLAPLGACGTEDGVAREDATPSAPTSADAAEATDSDVVVSCGGGPGWPASVMAEGLPDVLPPDDARATFRQILEDPRTAAEAELTILAGGAGHRVPRPGRRRHLDDGRVGPVDGGRPGDDAYVLGLERVGDRWESEGWGDCSRLQPVPPEDSAWLEIHGHRVDGDSLVLRVSEIECTSARDPRPFLREPVVTETEKAVTILATVTPYRGAARCPGNPVVEQVVELAEPLGERAVLDGSLHPARPVPGS